MKTFLSIGTGPGIGYETAERFAREGFRVVLSARNLDNLKVLVKRLEEAGYEAYAEQIDAADPQAIAQLIAETQARFTGLDVTHYNAAIIRQASLADQPLDTFNHDLNVNIGGALAAAQASLNIMCARKSGTLLLTGGFFGIEPNADYLSLSLGKAGIRALAAGLFESAKNDHVHVATVTVAAFVEPESEEAIGVAQAFWNLHSQKESSWTAEATYSR